MIRSTSDDCASGRADPIGGRNVRLTHEAESGGHALILCDPVKLCWRELQEHICGLLGVRSGWLSAPAWLAYVLAYICAGAYHLVGARSSPPLTPYRVRHVAMDYHFVPEKARRLIGYEPRIDWREGMRRAVTAYRSGAEVAPCVGDCP